MCEQLLHILYILDFYIFIYIKCVIIAQEYLTIDYFPIPTSYIAVMQSLRFNLYWRTTFLESIQKMICVTQAFGRLANYQRNMLCNAVHILCTLCASVALCSFTLSLKFKKKQETLWVTVSAFCKLLLLRYAKYQKHDHGRMLNPTQYAACLHAGVYMSYFTF